MPCLQTSLKTQALLNRFPFAAHGRAALTEHRIVCWDDIRQSFFVFLFFGGRHSMVINSYSVSYKIS